MNLGNMAEKEKKEAKVTANLTQESVKTVSESVGISGLADDAAARLAVDTTYKLKQIIQVSLFCDEPHLGSLVICNLEVPRILNVIIVQLFATTSYFRTK